MRGSDRAVVVAIACLALLLVGTPAVGAGTNPLVGAPHARSVEAVPTVGPDATAIPIAPAPALVPRAFSNVTLSPSLLPKGPSASPPPISAVQVTPPPIPPASTPTVMTFLTNSTTCCVISDFAVPGGGPWEMIVLNYTGQAVSGVYDSSFRAYVDQVQVLFGTTPEYGIWYVSQDITRYASLFSGGTFNFTFLLSAAVTNGYFLTSVSLAFYPPAPGEFAPSVPDLILPLFHRVFVSTTTPVVYANAVVPTNVVNATLELWTYGFGPDEFWYATQQSYRAMYVGVDGSPITAVLPFPYINTGGEDLFAWRPITAVFTLSDRPYEYDVTAALGMIEGSHNFSANISGVTASSNWLIGGALLLYTDASYGPATTLAYRFSAPPPRFTSGSSTAAPSYSYASQISSQTPGVGPVTNVSLFANESFSETIIASSNGVWNNLTGRETLASHEVVQIGSTIQVIDRSVVFRLQMDLGQTVVITSTTGGTYPEFANFTTYFLNGDQEWSESTTALAGGLGPPVVLSSSFVDDRFTGGNNIFAGTEELTGPNAALLLSITLISSSTAIDYEQSDFSGRLTTTFSHRLAGSAYQPPGPFNAETVTIDVTQNPVVAFLLASLNVVDVGWSIYIVPVVAGGVAPYSIQYSGVPVDCLFFPLGVPLDPLAWWCAPAVPGYYFVTAELTDATGATVTTAVLVLIVNPAPSVSVASNTTILDVGQTAYASAIAYGGTGPITCNWFVDGSPQATLPCDRTFNFDTIDTGTVNITVIAQDTGGAWGASLQAIASVLLQVASLPSLTLDPPGNGNDTVGRAVVFAASVNGGSGNASFVWFVNNSVVDGVAGSRFTFVPAGAGTYAISVQAIDAAGSEAFAGPWTWDVRNAVAPVPATSAPNGIDPTTAVAFIGLAASLGAAVPIALLLRRRSRAGR